MAQTPAMKQFTDTNAVIVEAEGKIETVMDLLVTAVSDTMTGDKSTAVTDLVEAYDTARSAIELLKKLRQPAAP